MKSNLKSLIIISIGLLVLGCTSMSSLEKSQTKIKNIASIEDEEFDIITAKIGTGVGKMPYILKPAVYQNNAYIASFNGTIDAINTSDMTKLWQSKVGFNIASNVGVNSTQVIIGGLKGNIVALSRIDGSKLWSADLKSEINTAPVTAKDKIIIRTADERVVALSKSTGKQLWTFDSLKVQFAIDGQSEPIVVDNSVFYGTDSGHVMQINLTTGKLEWGEPITIAHANNAVDSMSDVDATPIFDKGRLYLISNNGNFVKIDPKTAKLDWSMPYSSIRTPANFSNSMITVHQYGKITSFAKSNGNQIWEIKDLFGYPLTNPIKIDNELFAVGIERKNYVFFINKTNGLIKRKLKIRGKGGILSTTKSQEGYLVYTRDGTVTNIVRK